jgi:hypothetical protein
MRDFVIAQALPGRSRSTLGVAPLKRRSRPQSDRDAGDRALSLDASFWKRHGTNWDRWHLSRIAAAFRLTFGKLAEVSRSVRSPWRNGEVSNGSESQSHSGRQV